MTVERSDHFGPLELGLYLTVFFMHILYLDESGSVSDNNQKYLVFAGVSCFERQTFWLSNELDSIAKRFNPADPGSVELHGNPMFQGKGMWRSFKTDDRVQAIKDSLSVFAKSHPSNNAFVCVIDKSKCVKDPVEFCFEQLSSRFDLYLRRLHIRYGNTQRGIIVFDKSTYESTIQSLAINFRTIGHTWDVLRNLSEVPLFLDSKASRLIQLADLVAYSVFRSYEKGDDRFLSVFRHKIDQEGGVIHGLYELI